MLQFILKRLAYGILVMFGVVLVVFFLFNVLPVNSARLTLGQRADIATVEAIEKEFGLNLPLHKRLIKYIGDLSPLWIHENTPEARQKYEYFPLFQAGKGKVLALKVPYLSRSYQTRRKVSEILIEKIPPTLILALASILLASVIGILLGVVASLNHNRFLDNLAVTLSVVGISQPSYVSSILLLLIFTYWLYPWTGLDAGPLFDLNDYGEEVIVWKHLILPAIALGIRPVAIITQLTRNSMLDVLHQDYIRTARAKGLPLKIIIIRHALRNALNPVITSISGWFAALLAGAFFVELILDFKGLGYETVKALMNFDFPVVMGSVLFIALAFVLINIVVDILYGFLDPRVSVSGKVQ